jgi:hypothetical protein
VAGNSDAAFATLILLVSAVDKHRSPELTKAALVSGVVLACALLFSKNRRAVLLIIVGFAGIRGMVAFGLYGYWPGLVIAIVALGICIVLLRGITNLIR